MYDETVTTQLEKLTPLYREFVLSDVPSTIADIFAETLNVDRESKDTFTNAIILFLIFLLDRNEFKNFIVSECNIPRSKIENLDVAIVAALPSDIKGLFMITEVELEGILNTTPTDLINEINVTETSLKSINLQKGRQDETTYTSTQAAILTEKPASNFSAGAKWESEN